MIAIAERLNLAERQGNRIMRFSPFNIFQTTDGWVAIGAATDAEQPSRDSDRQKERELKRVGHHPLPAR